jgi:hypothetical protein
MENNKDKETAMEKARQVAVDDDLRLLALEKLISGTYHSSEQYEEAIEQLWDETFRAGYAAALDEKGDICPTCRHQSHSKGLCLNMASDSECECQAGENHERR